MTASAISANNEAVESNDATNLSLFGLAEARHKRDMRGMKAEKKKGVSLLSKPAKGQLSLQWPEQVRTGHGTTTPKVVGFVSSV